MIEETFYTMFTEKLRQAVRHLPEQRKMNNWASSVYEEEWHPFDQSIEPEATVVACDGSVGESGFSDGLGACVTRAVAHLYGQDGAVESVPDVDVEIGYGITGQSILMKALEMRTLAKAIRQAREKGRVFAVYDGALYLTLTTHYLPHLRSLADPLEKYVSGLTECLKEAQHEGVSLAGMSKDSTVTYLRSLILSHALEKMDKEAGRLLRQERSMARMIRKLQDLISTRQAANQPTTTLEDYLSEFTRPVSDEGVYSELAKEPGFTTPAVLGPQTQFLTQQIGRGRLNWWDSAFRKDLESGVLTFGKLLKALDAFYEQPPTAITYWKPRPELGCYRIDIPSNLLIPNPEKSGNVEENALVGEDGVRAAKPILAGLNALSAPPHIVSPLTEVDVIVRLDQKLYKETYEPMIVEELTRSGFKVRTKRRSIRDFVMRGY